MSKLVKSWTGNDGRVHETNNNPDDELRIAPVMTPGIEEHLVSLTAPNSIEADQYRILRNVIEGRATKGATFVIGISSPMAGDGKTLTAINLAGALAQAPTARVLLLDADLRAPGVASFLGLRGTDGPGLVEAICDHRISLEDACKPSPAANLVVVPARGESAKVYELLSSPRLLELIESARGRYDYVVIDMPPLLPLPDCSLIVRCVDAIAIVVSAHQTPRKLVEEAIRGFQSEKLIGFVLNNADSPLPRGYYYGKSKSRDGK
jgi:capsular exopolysaccharide synthesis family protein